MLYLYSFLWQRYKKLESPKRFEFFIPYLFNDNLLAINDVEASRELIE